VTPARSRNRSSQPHERFDASLYDELERDSVGEQMGRRRPLCLNPRARLRRRVLMVGRPPSPVDACDIREGPAEQILDLRERRYDRVGKSIAQVGVQDAILSRAREPPQRGVGGIRVSGCPGASSVR
jgi:hypothetical protein